MIARPARHPVSLIAGLVALGALGSPRTPAAAATTGPGSAHSVQESVATASAGPPVTAQDSAAHARDEELDALTAEIGSRLRCPVCRQQSVAESSSQIARDMQRLIRDKLEAGETPEEIEAYFLTAYGDWILLRPKARGVNVLVYVLPALAFVLGGIWVAVRVRGGGGRDAAAEADAPAAEAFDSDLDETDRAWLEQAVRGS